MEETIPLTKLLPLLIPIILVQLSLQIYTLVDLVKQKKPSLPKWSWAIIIVLFNILGPVLYLIFGRKES